MSQTKRVLFVLATTSALLAVGLPARASTDLFQCFQAGSGAAFSKVCISRHGNISQFTAPAGAEHIRAGYIGEGYAICSGNGGTVHGWDAGQDESAWGQTSVSAGPTITRTTTNGAFRIRQTLAYNGLEGRWVSCRSRGRFMRSVREGWGTVLRG